MIVAPVVRRYYNVHLTPDDQLLTSVAKVDDGTHVIRLEVSGPNSNGGMFGLFCSTLEQVRSIADTLAEYLEMEEARGEEPEP
jgi:hypothetical protein